jgi:hypothetical protein
MATMDMMWLLPFFTYYIFSIIPLAAAIYLFLKWRACRDGTETDPQLGAKTVFYYFKTLAYQILLIGLVLILVGALKGDYCDEMKMGLGLFLGGGLVFALFYFLRHRLPGAELVCRFYAGFNLIVTGVLAMTSLVAGCVIVFNGKLKDLRLPLAGLVVFGLAALFQASRFFGFPKLGKR